MHFRHTFSAFNGQMVHLNIPFAAFSDSNYWSMRLSQRLKRKDTNTSLASIKRNLHVKPIQCSMTMRNYMKRTVAFGAVPLRCLGKAINNNPRPKIEVNFAFPRSTKCTTCRFRCDSFDGNLVARCVAVRLFRDSGDLDASRECADAVCKLKFEPAMQLAWNGTVESEMLL